MSSQSTSPRLRNRGGGPRRDLAAARDAFTSRDPAASVRAHAPPPDGWTLASAEPGHGGAGAGGTDGLRACVAHGALEGLAAAPAANGTSPEQPRR